MSGLLSGPSISGPLVSGLAAAAAAAWVIGQAWRPGPVFNLDLVLVGRVPMPRALWGLGPDLPRRVPFGAFWSASSWLGTIGPKLLLVGLLGIAAAGMTRLLFGRGLLVAVVTGVFYAVNPFTATRLAVGHWHVLATVAALPWAAPLIARSLFSSDSVADPVEPRAEFGRALRGSLLLSLGGATGGAYLLAVVVANAVHERRVRARVVMGALVGQLPWVVPGMLILPNASSLTGGSYFPTNLAGPAQWIATTTGYGFWRSDSEAFPLTAAVVLGLLWVAGLVAARRGRTLESTASTAITAVPKPVAGAQAGENRNTGGVAPPVTSDQQRSTERVLWALAAAAFIGALSSGVPGLRSLHAWATEHTWGAPLRDSQRLAGLWLFVAVGPAVAGWAGLVRRAAAVWQAVVPALLVAAVALCVATSWSARNQLRSVDMPFEWDKARQVVQADPGPVLALPWHQYYDLGIAGGRRSLAVFADFLAADVVSAADPELSSSPRVESVDPRVAGGEEVVTALRRGQAVSPQLLRLGIRWVVVGSDLEGLEQRQRLEQDFGLRRVVAGPSLALFEVQGWDDASARPLLGLPWLRSVGGGESGARRSVWATVPESGWRSGMSGVPVVASGVDVSGSGGVVWSQRGAVLLSIYLGLLVLAAVTRPSPRVRISARTLRAASFLGREGRASIAGSSRSG